MNECTCEPTPGDMCLCNTRQWNGSPEDYRRLEAKIDAVLAISKRVEEMATAVAAQVKPTIDLVMKSPILKMLGVKL